MTNKAKKLLRGALRRCLTSRSYCRLLAWRLGHFEPELRLLPALCDRRKSAIDVGASNGSYAVHLLAHCAACHAFEPRADALGYLRERLAAVAGERLHTEAVALSDHKGMTTLRVLDDEPGRSSLQQDNPIEGLGTVSHRPVPMRRLDDYPQLRDVCLVKVDVEGHEGAVLRGAERLLERERPSLIVEMEERHCPGTVRDVTVWLADAGYRGWFLEHGRLRPVACFDPERHQGAAAGESYVNNFVFVTAEREPLLRPWMLPGARPAER